jgi:hypothetical protein
MIPVRVYYCNLDELVKSHYLDGTVKSARCKARESLGMRRTYKYVGMTKDEAQRSRWTFYEAVNLDKGDFGL